MARTMEQAIIEAGTYDGVIIRRRTWDGCVAELIYGVDGDRHIIPSIEIAFAPNTSRKYIFVGRRLENRQRPYGGDDMTYLVAEYEEVMQTKEESAGE